MKIIRLFIFCCVDLINFYLVVRGSLIISCIHTIIIINHN